MTDSDLAAAADRLEARLCRGLNRLRRRRENDDADGLLPELATPFPQTRLVRFAPHPDAVTLPAGTALEAVDDAGPAVSWRTAAPVHLHPFDVTAASLGGAADGWPPLPGGVRTAVRLIISAPTAARLPDRLSLQLNGPEVETFPLFQALTRDLVAAFARIPGCRDMPFTCQAVEEGGTLFPTPAGLPAESRLLNELFFCPAKLLCLELSDLPAANGSVELLIATRTVVPRLPARLFSTRCVPVVNGTNRKLPMIEIDPTRDEWDLQPPAGEEVCGLVRVEAYDRNSGEWAACDGWQLVRRRGRAALAFRRPLFGPADPATRFVRVTARCHRPAASVPQGTRVEARGAAGELGPPQSPAVRPTRGGLSRWFASGHAEPFTAAAFRRLLAQQAVLGGRVSGEDRPAETGRRRRARRMILGLRLIAVDRDEHHTPAGDVFHGRQLTLEVKPDHFPGAGYWPAVLAVGRFLAAGGPMNQFTRLIVRTTPGGEEFVLPPAFGRRAGL